MGRGNKKEAIVRRNREMWSIYLIGAHDMGGECARGAALISIDQLRISRPGTGAAGAGRAGWES